MSVESTWNEDMTRYSSPPDSFADLHPEIYQEGLDACLKGGVFTSDNPYDMESMAGILWLEGYQSAGGRS